MNVYDQAHGLAHAIKASEEYKQYDEAKKKLKEKFDELMQWDKLVFVHESEESKSLVSSKEPCFILSSAGMCNVGRIRHHLKAVIPDPNATVLMVGFSTPGSLGALLKDPKTKTVTIDFKEYKCRCSYSRSRSKWSNYSILYVPPILWNILG